LKAFRLNPEKWGVNVQPYSGSPANFEVYTALLQPHERIMGLDLPSGGHLTHGYYTPKGKKISATSIFFESFPYKVDNKTGYVDYDKLEEQALTYRPKLIVCGASAYPREWDYARLRKIADNVGAYLLDDMAHISGLVAAQVVANPFEHAHIVTTTTHKTLRGPRAGMIFFRKDKEFNFEDRINQAVFPALQGGPHNNVIAAIAVQLKEVMSPEWVTYAKQVRANATALAIALQKRGHKLVTDGTDNHLVLWDLRPQKMTGSKYVLVCDECNITLNKNTIHGDANAINPGGVRVGTPALTSRGYKEADFEQVAEFLDRAFKIAAAIQTKSGPKVEDFKKLIPNHPDIKALREDVEAYASKFFMPGFDINKHAH